MKYLRNVSDVVAARDARLSREKEGKLNGKMIIEEIQDPEKKAITEIASKDWETYSMDYLNYRTIILLNCYSSELRCKSR